MELLEVLHAHLKGVAADSSEVQPGQAAQPSKGGVCAEADGVFLKTALLYLASQEVRNLLREVGVMRVLSSIEGDASRCLRWSIFMLISSSKTGALSRGGRSNKAQECGS